MTPFYIKHLLCALIDSHFGSRLAETSDDASVTMSIGELLHALREAFEMGQDVRNGR